MTMWFWVMCASILTTVVLAVDILAELRSRDGSAFWRGYIDGRRALWNFIWRK